MDKAEIDIEMLKYPSDRLDNGMSLYKDVLKDYCNTDAFALSFEMRNIFNVRLYHMIFISCHEKGLEAMKEAMNRGSQNRTCFALSDFLISKKGQQMNLQNGQVDADVAGVIFERFNGDRSVSIKTVRNFVIHETIFVWRKGPLKILNGDKRIASVVSRNGEYPKRKKTFPDHTEWFLTFAADFENVVED